MKWHGLLFGGVLLAAPSLVMAQQFGALYPPALPSTAATTPYCGSGTIGQSATCAAIIAPGALTATGALVASSTLNVVGNSTLASVNSAGSIQLPGLNWTGAFNVAPLQQIRTFTGSAGLSSATTLYSVVDSNAVCSTGLTCWGILEKIRLNGAQTKGHFVAGEFDVNILAPTMEAIGSGALALQVYSEILAQDGGGLDALGFPKYSNSFAVNFESHLGPATPNTAIFAHAAIGGEVDIWTEADAIFQDSLGWSIVTVDGNKNRNSYGKLGGRDNIGLDFGSQFGPSATLGWDTGIAFGTQGGFFPINTGGALIRVENGQLSTSAALATFSWDGINTATVTFPYTFAWPLRAGAPVQVWGVTNCAWMSQTSANPSNWIAASVTAGTPYTLTLHNEAYGTGSLNGAVPASNFPACNQSGVGTVQTISPGAGAVTAGGFDLTNLSPTAFYYNDGHVMFDPNGAITTTGTLGVAGTSALKGVRVARRTIGSGSTDTASAADYQVNWNSASGFSKTANIPACATGIDGMILVEKDEYGDALTHPITVKPPSGTINGAATFVIQTVRGFVTLNCDASTTNWTVD